MATPICGSFRTRLNALLQFAQTKISENQPNTSDTTNVAANKADSLVYWTDVYNALEAIYAL